MLTYQDAPVTVVCRVALVKQETGMTEYINLESVIAATIEAGASTYVHTYRDFGLEIAFVINPLTGNGERDAAAHEHPEGSLLWEDSDPLQ